MLSKERAVNLVERVKYKPAFDSGRVKDQRYTMCAGLLLSVSRYTDRMLKGVSSNLNPLGHALQHYRYEPTATDVCSSRVSLHGPAGLFGRVGSISCTGGQDASSNA